MSAQQAKGWAPWVAIAITAILAIASLARDNGVSEQRVSMTERDLGKLDARLANTERIIAETREDLREIKVNTSTVAAAIVDLKRDFREDRAGVR
jgi:septal ring factor EnvC (AmiA/AmiB activator)